MNTMRSLLILTLALAAGAAFGQMPTAVITEGAPIPNAPDYVVTSINTPDVNGPDGWCFTANTTSAGQTLSLAYGTLLGGVPALLRVEGGNAVYTQDSWETFFGMSDTDVCYSPSCTRLDDGQSGLDSVWNGDAIVAIEEEPFPYRENWYWSFGSRPGVTRDGTPYFVGGITDIKGGSTQERGLFYGPDGAPLIMGGMMIGGLPDPVATNTSNVDFDFRFSAYGTHYVAVVQTATGSTLNDDHLVMDGNVVMAGGLPLSENGVVPASIGGLPGELWDNWDYMGVTENGDWMITGDTTAASTVDEFVMVNGVIVLREGDMVDGMVLNGSIESGYLGEDGDWAVVWDVDTVAGNVEALIVDGMVMLMEGMPVDADGDGSFDVDTMITDFTGIAALAVSDRAPDNSLNVLFTADVDDPSVPLGAESQVLAGGEAEGLGADDVVEPRDTRGVVEMALVLHLTGTVGNEDPGDQTPASRFALAQNHPNPFNPSTRIAFSLAAPEPVSLKVFDMDGRLVRTLVEGVQTAGDHETFWDGTDASGRRVASGTYLYRLQTAARVLSRTMVLVK